MSINFKKIPGFSYSIDQFCNIWPLLERIPEPIFHVVNGKPCVTLANSGRSITFSCAALLIYCFLINNNDSCSIEDIVPKYKDGDPSNIALVNLAYAFEKVDHKDGFRPIPKFTNYRINRDGLVHNIKTGNILKGIPNQDGYLCIRLKLDICSNTSRTVNVRIHRLVAIVFLDPPDNIYKTYVNHIDGIKSNPSVSNLEWVTPQENNLHAVRTGLCSFNEPILVRNVFTQEIKEYFSISEAGRQLSIPHNTMLQRLTKSGQPLWPNGYQFKLVSDKTDWREPVDIHLEMKELKAPQAIKVLNVFTGLEFTFVDCAEAENKIGVSMATLKWVLNKATRVVPVYGHLIKYTWDEAPWPTYTDFQLKCFKRNPKDVPLPVRCTDITNDCIQLFTCVAEVNEVLHVNENTIKTCIRNKKPFNGVYMFEYLDLLTLQPHKPIQRK